MDLDAIRGWLAVLDKLTFYELLDVDPRAPFDDIHAAFLRFAAEFHPDAHTARPSEERVAIEKIFRRANEGYRVLSSRELRHRYDELLARVPGALPSATALQEPGPAGVKQQLPPKPKSNRLEDQVRKSAARPFVRRAEELVKGGDPKQARIQLVLAMHMDVGNKALEDFMKVIETQIAAQKRK